jgi:hypothetical protein
MTAERIRTLDDIGFEFETTSALRSSCVKKSRNASAV